MAGVNKAIIVGRLGNDPEIRTMPNGDPVAKISVATSEEWTDKQSGEKKQNTEWHTIIAFRKLADIIGQYLKKRLASLCRRQNSHSQMARPKRTRPLHH